MIFETIGFLEVVDGAAAPLPHATSFPVDLLTTTTRYHIGLEACFGTHLELSTKIRELTMTMSLTMNPVQGEPSLERGQVPPECQHLLIMTQINWELQWHQALHLRDDRLNYHAIRQIQPTQLTILHQKSCSQAIEEGIAKVIGRMVEDVGQFAGEDANWTAAESANTPVWLLHYAIARLPDDFMAPANWVTPEAKVQKCISEIHACLTISISDTKNADTTKDEEEDAEANQSRNKAIHLTPQRTSTGPPLSSLIGNLYMQHHQASSTPISWVSSLEIRISTEEEYLYLSLNPANARRAISDMFALMPYSDEELGNMVDAVQPAELTMDVVVANKFEIMVKAFIEPAVGVFHRTNDLPFPLNKPRIATLDEVQNPGEHRMAHHPDTPWRGNQQTPTGQLLVINHVPVLVPEWQWTDVEGQDIPAHRAGATDPEDRNWRQQIGVDPGQKFQMVAVRMGYGGVIEEQRGFVDQHPEYINDPDNHREERRALRQERKSYVRRLRGRQASLRLFHSDRQHLHMRRARGIGRQAYRPLAALYLMWRMSRDRLERPQGRTKTKNPMGVRRHRPLPELQNPLPPQDGDGPGVNDMDVDQFPEPQEGIAPAEGRPAQAGVVEEEEAVGMNIEEEAVGMDVDVVPGAEIVNLNDMAPMMYVGYGNFSWQKPHGSVETKRLTRELAIQGSTAMFMSENGTTTNDAFNYDQTPGCGAVSHHRQSAAGQFCDNLGSSQMLAHYAYTGERRAWNVVGLNEAEEMEAGD
ncbi:hypothetical protein BC829DRAFT_443390 [Chytridium lagenaria]|nr:hypothetical protein BC829DRAFT_443390 [Chytridium lagenaria]